MPGETEPLWWCARGIFPAWTSNATATVLVAGVDSATLDTGIAAGQLGILSINNPTDGLRIIFSATTPIGTAAAAMFFGETDTDNDPMRFLVTAQSRYFMLRHAAGITVNWQVEVIQG